MTIYSDFITPLKAFFKKKVFTTDNNAFRFFYRVTFAIHVLFCFLLGASQFFGNPIHCAIRNTHVDKDVINNYCWITGTWTVQDKEPDEIVANVHRRKV